MYHPVHILQIDALDITCELAVAAAAIETDDPLNLYSLKYTYYNKYVIIKKIVKIFFF